MHKVIVLGAGRVGHVIARDLNDDENIEVTIADRRKELLEEVGAKIGCPILLDNLADEATVTRLVSDYDLAVGALPGALGFQTVRAILAAGKPCVDISFMPEDPATLNDAATAAGVPVIYDIGVAPGMSNLLAAAAAEEVAPARQIRILVGGLPVVRRQPWEYAAPFSPADVMEEYVRPARVKIGGKITERPALSGIELLELPELGTLEAFYTDGLRSLLHNLDCPSMEEKTLRYPGYAKRIGLLRDSGFLGTKEIDVNGTMIAPIDVTLKLLEPAWHLDDMMEEFTVMRVEATGGSGRPFNRMVWELFDRTDRDRRQTSMARTTGFPAAIVARKLLDGSLSVEPGVHAPEALAGDKPFLDDLLEQLKARGVVYKRIIS